jgi:hypothetical protein
MTNFKSLLNCSELFHQLEMQKQNIYVLSCENHETIGCIPSLILWSGLWSTDTAQKLPNYEVLNNQSEYFFFKETT